jgi:hypothetical protein
MSRPAAPLVFARDAFYRALLLGAVFLAGCASGGSGQVSGSVYAGVGYNDPWYWGACCYDDPSVIVGPGGGRPSNGRPGARPEQPIAKPLPSPRPTPMPRPAAGGRRR